MDLVESMHVLLQSWSLV